MKDTQAGGSTEKEEEAVHGRASEMAPLDTLALVAMEGDDYEETQDLHKFLASDDVSDMTSGESFEEGSTISMAKMRFAGMLQNELENDVAEGLLISKEQYDHLRFEDEKIMHLRNAKVRVLTLLIGFLLDLELIEFVLDRIFGSCT